MEEGERVSFDEDEHARASERSEQQAKRAAKSEQQKACYPQLVYVLLLATLRSQALMKMSMRASERSEQQAKRAAAKSEQQKACYPQLVYVLLARDASLASLDENEHTRDESTPAKMLQT